MGEGNQFQRLLVGPAAERLLGIQPGEAVLDVACGNGVFARRLAMLGAEVVATDFSEGMLRQARAYPADYPGSIDYRLADATDEDELLALGIGRFDAIVCNMALMDMPETDPLFQSVSRLLAPRGRFVFTICHPCFNTSGIRMVVESEDSANGPITTWAIKIMTYLHLGPTKGTGMVGQPVAQHYFDRPLSVLLGSCFRAGLVLDGIEEPEWPDNTLPDHPLTWPNFTEIPPVLAVRLRLGGT
jgi:2-polyprenyl-3-methyl-5-hydroxy-6-metoxy-1,4-benzoquinol methylase